MRSRTGSAWGCPATTHGAYRGHLFDDETNELVGHAELHEVGDDEDLGGLEYVYIDEDDSPSASNDLPRTVVLAVVGLRVAAAVAPSIMNWLKKRRSRKERSEGHVDNRDVARPGVTKQPAPSAHISQAAAPQEIVASQAQDRPGDEDDRIPMTSQEWQELVRAWLTAGAVGEELWRRLTNAHIQDADPAVLASQRQMEGLTPQQGANRIRRMLEADPSMRPDDAIAALLAHLQDGGSARATGHLHHRGRDALH